MHRKELWNGKSSEFYVVAPEIANKEWYTQMEAKLILARLLQVYSVRLPQDYELMLFQSVTIRPKGPMQCTVEKRM